VKIVERIPAHYEVQEVSDFARSYRWCPEKVVLECGACRTRTTYKRVDLISSLATCECGARCSASVREELICESLVDDEQRIHPWRYWHSEKSNGLPL
jgi:hypothetical protein